MPAKMSSRMFNTKDGSVKLSTTFSKESCEEIEKLHLKHKEKLSKCEESSREINSEFFHNPKLLQSLQMGTGPGMGMGMNMFGSPYGFSNSNQLSMMKNYCDHMLGAGNLGMGGIGLESKDTTTGKQ